MYYVDDTLLLTRGRDWEDAIANANMAIECALRAISVMGLKVTINKTALFFYKGAWRE